MRYICDFQSLNQQNVASWRKIDCWVSSPDCQILMLWADSSGPVPAHPSVSIWQTGDETQQSTTFVHKATFCFALINVSWITEIFSLLMHSSICAMTETFKETNVQHLMRFGYVACALPSMATQVCNHHCWFFFFFFFLQKNSQSQIDKILPSVLELPRLPKSPMMFCLNQPLHHAKYQRDRRAKHFPRSGK